MASNNLSTQIIKVREGMSNTKPAADETVRLIENGNEQLTEMAEGKQTDVNKGDDKQAKTEKGDDMQEEHQEKAKENGEKRQNEKEGEEKEDEYVKEKGGGEGNGAAIELNDLITNHTIPGPVGSVHKSARDGDVENLRAALNSYNEILYRRDPHIHAHDKQGRSPLHYAARYHHLDCVKLLVEYDAYINDGDDEGATPLHFAARSMRLNVISDSDTEEESTSIDVSSEHVIGYLVSKGADVNERDIYGNTPLHYAISRRNKRATLQLLAVPSINIEAVDNQQQTPLHIAASTDDAAIVKALLETGPDLRCVDEMERTPLHIACMESTAEIVILLLEAAEQRDGWETLAQMMSDVDCHYNTALHRAVETQHFDIVKICIERRADVNRPRRNDRTPLHLAAMTGDVSIAGLLHDHGARMTSLDYSHQSPLHLAAKYGHRQMVQYLIEKGARINQPDNDNFTPLLLAAMEGRVDTLLILLQRGANVLAVTKSYKTVIFLSAENNHLENLKVLLQNPGGEKLLNVTDEKDDTPLHIAAEHGFLPIVRTLLDEGATMDLKNDNGSSPIHVAARRGHTAVVREFLRRNRQLVNQIDEDSNTPLHVAAQSGKSKAVSVIIEAGADIEARNAVLWTALDAAAAKGHAEVVQILLEADAAVDPIDKSKISPLHLACRRGHLQTVKVLLQHAADVSLKDTEGHNCLDMAIDNRHKEVAMEIINDARWEKAVRNEYIDKSTGVRTTPVRRLILTMPDVAEAVFDRCVREDRYPYHPEYSLTLKYEFLDDTYEYRQGGPKADIADEEDFPSSIIPYSNNSAVICENHPLMLIVKSKQKNLLSHPLVDQLLRYKWNRLGSFVYYTNLTLYSIFLVFLTAFLLASTPPYIYWSRVRFTPLNVTNETELSDCEKLNLLPPEPIHPFTKALFLTAGKYIILVLAIFAILREIFQLYKSRFAYLGGENLIECVIYITSILLVVDIGSCRYQDVTVLHDWQWQLGAVVIFLAWLNLVLFIRKLPRFGIYVVMFTVIIKTLVSFFPVFFLFILAFTFSFSMLFQNQYEFAGVGRSIVKTTVMMIGEYDFASLFLGEEENPGEYSHTVIYQEVSYIIFLIFIIVMSIIIMNLLVGLAVDDIQGVQESSTYKRLAMQVRLALEMEHLIPNKWSRRAVIRFQRVYPNRATNCCNIKTRIFSVDQREQDDRLKDEQFQDQTRQQLSTLQKDIQSLSEEMSRNQKLMNKLLKHMNIDDDDE